MEESPPGTESGITPPFAEPRPTAESSPMQQFDRALAEYERVGEQTDRQLLDVMRDFVHWKNKLPWTERVTRTAGAESWEREEPLGYRIITTAVDGTPRMLDVENPWSGKSLVTERDVNGTFLGTVNFVSEDDASLYGSKPTFRSGAAMVVGYTSADDPQWEEYQPAALDEEIQYASTAYGYTRGHRESTIHRNRYVAPGMKHLPSPLDKGAEINGMIQRGTITHRKVGGYDAEWQPFTPTPPTSSAPAAK